MEPITHDGPDRRYKECLCSVCGKVSTCTPENDFYGSNGEALTCEPCFWQGLSDEGYTRLPDMVIVEEEVK